MMASEHVRRQSELLVRLDALDWDGVELILRATHSARGAARC